MYTPQDYGALLLRVALGVMFLTHGLLKVLVFSLPGTVQFFESQGCRALWPTWSRQRKLVAVPC